MIIFLAAYYLLTSISLYFLFPKANRPAQKALIPGVNILEGCDIVGRPRWWAALMLIPVVNIFIYAGLAIDIIRSFGKEGYWHWVAVVVAAPAYFFWLSRQADAKYLGPVLQQEKEYYDKIKAAEAAGKKSTASKLRERSPYKKSGGREWAESIVFAVFAAAFLRMFLVEAFIIPTPSMEGSLKQGDFLFVNKMAYGVRMPNTPLMIPLLHNRIPKLNRESYLSKPQLKYTRTAAMESIDVNDPIVFNWPIGDSVYLSPARSFAAEQVRREPGLKSQLKGAKLITRPVDKKDHYIKRCLGVAGDSLEIRNRTVYINGAAIENSEFAQWGYTFDAPGIMDEREIKKFRDIEVYSYDLNPFQRNKDNSIKYQVNLSDDEVELWNEKYPKYSLSRFQSDSEVWPYHSRSKEWNIDNFGPIYIPKAGESVELNDYTAALYGRCINVYENNDFDRKGDKFFVNGEEVTSYTFEMDYYWGMGDNRHASEDSRFWGFVPEDHIVGKPLVIWMSLHEAKMSEGINWKRVFKSGNVF